MDNTIPEQVYHGEWSLWNLSLIAVSAICLGFYDYLIGLADEFRYVWNHKFTGATVLFLLNRYILLVRLIVTAITLGAWGTDRSCSILLIMITSLNIAAQIVLALLASLRIYAIWNRGIIASCITVAFHCAAIVGYLIQVVVSSLRPGSSHIAFNSTTLGCYESVPRSGTLIRVYIISNAFAVAADFSVLALTWLKTFNLMREATALGIKVPFTSLMLRDGTIQFGTIFVLRSFQVFFVVDPDFKADLAQAYLTVLTSIMMTHFFINLREVHLKDRDSISSGGSYRSMSLRFASSLVGNLGAPVHSIFTNADEREESPQTPHFSDNPLAYGLLLTEEPEHDPLLSTSESDRKTLDDEELYERSQSYKDDVEAALLYISRSLSL